MIATKSYIDINGQMIVDGEPLSFHKRQQNLKAKPSRHRKQEPINQQAYIRSFKDAVAGLFVLMGAITAMALFLAWVKY